MGWHTPAVSGRIYLGVVLGGLGAVWLLDVAGVLVGGDTIGRWWPLALVGLGGAQLMADRSSWAGSSMGTIGRSRTPA